jgi:hypothetical protein
MSCLASRTGHQLNDEEKVLTGGALVTGAVVGVSMARGVEAGCE